MNDTTTQLIGQLADKLGVTAEHLWASLLRQAEIHGYFLAGLCMASCLVALSAAVIHARIMYRGHKHSLESSLWLGGVCVGFALIAVGTGHGSATALLNPEYWALQEVLRAVNNR